MTGGHQSAPVFLSIADDESSPLCEVNLLVHGLDGLPIFVSPHDQLFFNNACLFSVIKYMCSNGMRCVAFVIGEYYTFSLTHMIYLFSPGRVL